MHGRGHHTWLSLFCRSFACCSACCCSSLKRASSSTFSWFQFFSLICSCLVRSMTALYDSARRCWCSSRSLFRATFQSGSARSVRPLPALASSCGDTALAAPSCQTDRRTVTQGDGGWMSPRHSSPPREGGTAYGAGRALPEDTAAAGPEGIWNRAAAPTVALLAFGEETGELGTVDRHHGETPPGKRWQCSGEQMHSHRLLPAWHQGAKTPHHHESRAEGAGGPRGQEKRALVLLQQGTG